MLAVIQDVQLKRSQSAHFSQSDFAHKHTTQRQEHDQKEIFFPAVLLVLTVNLILIHCKQDSIYVFPEMKLRGLVPNSQIRISQNRRTDRGNTYINRLQIYKCGNWKRRRAVLFLGIFVFKLSVECVCRVLNCSVCTIVQLIKYVS